MSVIGGVMFHAVGASFAALCYTPQKKVTNWSWQTYWLAQAFFCWFLLPIVGAWLTIPELMKVLEEAPTDAMWKAFGLGMAYGVGGTAFGIAIRYIGFSLTYAISIGISCVVGTLLPPLVKGELSAVLQQEGASWIVIGMVLGVLGIALCGLAGRYKELDLAKLDKSAESNFSVSKGLPLCILAGVLSALYGFSIDQGQPIADVAVKYGAGGFQSNVIYIFSNTGAFIVTLAYCLSLHRKQRTFGEFTERAKSPLTKNYLFAIMTGLMWYSQFFFYGLGHVQMGDYKFTSWAVHMIMLVMFSTVAGLVMKEWIHAKGKTIWALVLALAVLLVAVLALTVGNAIGG
ncbi:rhamnose:proton symporter [Echinicola soli]|uniref:Rhamnose:proton symporter n=1 Tax=Echinicola soli TaxID=2591634 RepID=A0A514CGU4_9BACT|nr:L-rhamnose/proton symporter RhaT [Echinicola soli]QDH79000.1 rhamnose:proton symporter [Echinicola soli]